MDPFRPNCFGNNGSRASSHAQNKFTEVMIARIVRKKVVVATLNNETE